MRRRPFRPRRPITRQQVNTRRPIPAKLREANRLFEIGEYKKAGDLFREIAEKTQQRGIPQAPNLYLKGAISLIKSGEIMTGEEILFKGLDLLITRKKWAQLRRASDFTSKMFKDEGFSETAAKIDEWVSKQVPETIRNSDLWTKTGVSRNPQIKLVSNCQNCGANVNPKEIDWIESSYAVCAYCGSILTADE